MRRRAHALISLICFAGVAAGARSASCTHPEGRRIKHLSGEVFGDHPYLEAINDEWRLQLLPSRYGWDLRVLDRAGMDLSQITPPFHGVPNPRQIYGWHFRNAANTAANTGDVNAPQRVRTFRFSPELTGSGGFRPPRGAAPPMPHDSGTGRGSLTILDAGLADLEEGKKARFNYLKFEVCLDWEQETEEELGSAGAAEAPGSPTEELAPCGLPADEFEPGGWLAPSSLSGDLDGDGVLETITPIRRRADGRAGLVICGSAMAATQVGFDAGASTPLKTKRGEPKAERYLSLAEFLEQSEAWQIRPGAGGADELILSRIEKAEVAIRWSHGTITHELLWAFVEP